MPPRTVTWPPSWYASRWPSRICACGASGCWRWLTSSSTTWRSLVRVEEFEGLLELQVKAVGELRTALINCQALLATIDAGFYLELAPFLDTKSGLITRWSQQVWQSRFSTTTLFFLQADSLQRVVEIGRAQANPKGLNRERSAYLMAVADGIRSARSHEVRDLRHAVARNNQPTVKSEIATARADLARTRVLCGHLLAATQEAVGPEVMARLRRTLVPQSRRD